jgi:thiamine biosynthesis lipoprotein
MMPSPLAASRTLATLGGQTMGTTWSARLAIPSHLDLHRLHALLQGELDRVVAQMSTWEASSALCHYNRAAAGSWQVLPEDFARVMAAALRIARDSEGAFDPTVGALVHAWGFGAGGGTPALPPEQTLQQARARPRWSQLALRGQPLALLQPGAVQLDLSAIAKGYAVDLLLHALGRRGIDDALVEVGGELAGRGRKPDGTPWRVLVETGADEQAPLPARVLALDGLAVATSGDRWHRFEHDGVRYGHTLDPRSGRPVPQAAAVTVVMHSAMEADAWATALTVMGAEAGLRFAQAQQMAARLVVASASGIQEHMSERFAALLAA